MSIASVTRRAMQVVIREVVFDRDPQLAAEVIAMATGVLNVGNVAFVARKHKVSRQAVSKRVIKFCEKWGLPQNPKLEKKDGVHFP